jgi:hypothetical protein
MSPAADGGAAPDTPEQQLQKAWAAYRKACFGGTLDEVQDRFMELVILLGRAGEDMPPAPAILRDNENAMMHVWAAHAEARREGRLERQVAAPAAEPANVMRLAGEVWHLLYGDEAGDFQDRQGSPLHHLARLLAEPNRRFAALEFYPPPKGTAPLPHLGRDDSSDDQALKEGEEELLRLAREIKEADDAHDTETAAKLREKFDRLTEHVESEKAARKRGHRRKCGTPSPGEKADQALRVGLEKLKGRFRTKGLPKLADHLDKYLGNSGCVWWYAPSPDTSPWQVTRPDPQPEK